jgi:hypothetical protein
MATVKSPKSPSDIKMYRKKEKRVLKKEKSILEKEKMHHRM